MCGVRRMRHQAGEEKNLNRYSLLLTLTSDERTNERFFPLISRDRGNAFATQDAPCHRRSRSDRNSITKLFSRPAPIPVDKFPQCGLRAHRATDPIARPSCNREKGAARGESVLIPRVGWDGSDGIERLASNFGWNNFCNIFLLKKKKKIRYISIFCVFTFVFGYFYFIVFFFIIISFNKDWKRVNSKNDSLNLEIRSIGI